MSFTHILRVLFAIAISGAAGWVFLLGYNSVRIIQQFEAFEVAAPNGDLDGLPRAMLDAIGNIEGGSALFLGAGIAGVLLSEIFKTRALLFYSAATGGLTAVLAAALWQQGACAWERPDCRCARNGRVCGGGHLLDDRRLFRAPPVTRACRQR